MSKLIPVDAPNLQPLRASFERDQLETELKAVFVNVFTSMLRPAERDINLLGMPHLGSDNLLKRNLKASGVPTINSTTARLQFLLKTARGRHDRRGTIFIKKYLQALWPNVWKVEPLWHPIATAANYPNELTPRGDPETHFLTGRIRISLPISADNGIGMTEIAKAFRAVLAARLMLEFNLSDLVFDNTAMKGGLALANAATGIMPFTAIGTLQGPTIT